MNKVCLGMVVCMLISFPAVAALPTNVAPLGYATHPGLIDEKCSQVDCRQYAAVVWDDIQDIDRLIFDISASYVVRSYQIQVANPTLGRTPNPAVDTDWVNYGPAVTFAAGQTHTPFISFDHVVTNGVRFLPLDTYNNAGWDDGVLRMAEIWAFTNYFSSNNIAPQARIYSNTWSLGNNGYFNDETMSLQAYSNNYETDPYAYIEFDAPVTIDSFMLFGGTGGEILGGFTLEFWNGQEYLPATNAAVVTDNTTWLVARDLDEPVTAALWRLNVTAGNADKMARVSEIMLFSSLPEPATMSLLVLGGLALLRRKQ